MAIYSTEVKCAFGENLINENFLAGPCTVYTFGCHTGGCFVLLLGGTHHAGAAAI